MPAKGHRWTRRPSRPFPEGSVAQLQEAHQRLVRSTWRLHSPVPMSEEGPVALFEVLQGLSHLRSQLLGIIPLNHDGQEEMLPRFGGEGEIPLTDGAQALAFQHPER